MTTVYHSLTFVVIVVPSVVTHCQFLSLDVSLVCLFINDLSLQRQKQIYNLKIVKTLSKKYLVYCATGLRVVQ